VFCRLLEGRFGSGNRCRRGRSWKSVRSIAVFYIRIIEAGIAFTIMKKQLITSLSDKSKPGVTRRRKTRGPPSGWPVTEKKGGEKREPHLRFEDGVFSWD